MIETVLQIAQGSVQGVHPLLAEPFEADTRAKITGLSDLTPKPWPQRFREIQPPAAISRSCSPASSRAR